MAFSFANRLSSSGTTQQLFRLICREMKDSWSDVMSYSYLDADWFDLSVVVNIFQDRRVEITQPGLPNLALRYELLYCQPEL